MEKYESKQVKINRNDNDIYAVISDFNNFTPILKDRVEDWRVEGDSCFFKVKGFNVSLKFEEKEPFSCVKLSGGDNAPFEFFLWIQLKRIEENDTRMKLTLHAKLNMMIKMMIGGKIEEGLNQAADKIAEAFNARAAI